MESGFIGGNHMPITTAVLLSFLFFVLPRHCTAHNCSSNRDSRSIVYESLASPLWDNFSKTCQDEEAAMLVLETSKISNRFNSFLVQETSILCNESIPPPEGWGFTLTKSAVESITSGFIFTNTSSSDFTENLVIGDIVVSFGGSLLATCALLFPCCQRKKRSLNKEFPSKGTSSFSTSNSLGESSCGGSSSTAYSCSSSQNLLTQRRGGRDFTLDELSKATKKFSLSCRIGQGGFGIVYKGKLQDGTIVAIKRAKKKVYDSRLSTEFDNEVGIFLSIDHLNLVKMIGYLDESDERLLVVEYVPNGNLREHLDGIHGVSLDLSMRLDICIDVAHALTYLHMYAGKPIIHRDVKPSNILLTEKFRAKVSDFGYSRMGPIEIGETHVSTEVKGTTGYLDPEYLKTFQLTEKSDVYSFGILLIEITTGRRPIDEKKDMKEKVALRWAFRKYLDGNVSDILDPKLEKANASLKVTGRLCELAFQCTAPTKQDRPNMKEVTEVLWNIRKDFVSSLEEKMLQVNATEGDMV